MTNVNSLGVAALGLALLVLAVGVVREAGCDSTSTVTGDEEPRDLDKDRPADDARPSVADGITLEDEPSKWPGHLRPLAADAPAVRTVEKYKKGFPKPKLFFDDYVSVSVPLLMPNAAKSFPAAERWSDDAALFKHPASITSYVDVVYGKREERIWGSFDTVCFRRAVHNYKERLLVVDSLIPYYLRSDVKLPESLHCHPVLDLLKHPRMWMAGLPSSGDLTKSHLNQIWCQLRGESRLVLIPSKYKSQVPMDGPGGHYSLVDVNRVDFTEYPGLREVEYYPVNITGHDCLFIPHNWFYSASQDAGANVGVVFPWAHKILSVSESACAGGSKTSNMSRLLNATTAAAPSDSSSDNQTANGTTITIDKLLSLPGTIDHLSEFVKNGMIHYFADYVGPYNNLTEEQFRVRLKNDKEFLSKMTGWDDEYEEYTKELFHHLDADSDGVFTQTDLAPLTPDTIREYRDVLDDRVADIEALLDDQDIETATKHLKAMGEDIGKQYLKDYTDRLEKMVEESMKKVIDAAKQIDAAGGGKQSAGSTGNKDVEFEETTEYYESREDAKSKLRAKLKQKGKQSDESSEPEERDTTTAQGDSEDTEEIEEIMAEEDDTAQILEENNQNTDNEKPVKINEEL